MKRIKNSDILFYFAKKEKSYLTVPVIEQKNFIARFKEPSTFAERSYYQYRCQSFFAPLSQRSILNVFALFIILPYLFFIFVKGIFIREIKSVDAVAHFKEYPELLPESLRSLYSIDDSLWYNKHILKFDDICFIVKNLSLYIFHPYFVFKCIYNISKYSYYITVYKPKAIIDHAEFSCTSSILTAYCRRKGVKHINVQHGEKLFHIRDAFFVYDSCYVWDEYYKDLFVSLRAYEDQFVIERPRIFSVEKKADFHNPSYADYKYYLQWPSDEQVKSIVKSFDFAREKGMVVKFRVHPNHMNSDIVKLIPKEELEDPRIVSIEESLSYSCNVVGSYTTVLLHAFFSGINVILDDVTFCERYKKLKDYGYILMNKNVGRLSEYQNSSK